MTRRNFAANGFSIVELLVVLTILTVLVTLLVPSITAARELTKKIVCSKNIRQLNLAQSMYMNDNHQMIPFFGAYSGTFSGSYSSNTCWQSIYTDYLGLGMVGTYTTTQLSMRFTPMNSVLQCPSNPRKDSSRDAYVNTCGSAYDFLMTDERLGKTFTRLGMDRYGPSPAMLTDRAIEYDYIAGGVLRTETNHRNQSNGDPDGGNTAHLDGSVLWYGFHANAANDRSFVTNGAIFNLQSWPTTTLVFCTDGSGNLDLRSGNPNAQSGPNWTYTSLFQ